MAAAGEVRSIDELVGAQPRALGDAELKALLCGLAAARARLDAAEAAALAELDSRGCFAADGAVNARSWLAHHTGVPRAVAGARVLLARRLGRMPAMAAALAAGRVSAAHARALGRCLTPRTLDAFARDEAMLVGVAAELDGDGFDRVVTRWLALNDLDGPDPGTGPPSTLRASRTFGGRARVDGDLDVEDGAEVLAELDALTDQLWRQDRAAGPSDPLAARGRAERTAAALVEMARRSSATRTAGPGDGDERDGPRPRRPHLTVLVDLDALAGRPGGLAELDDGTPLPPSVLARWACDSAIARVVMRGRSQPLDLGATTYTPSPAQRRALVARDRGCIVPGCHRPPRWCHAHHIVPWPHGPTDLDNLVLLCPRHHQHVHGHVLTLVRHGPRWRAARPDGTPLKERPPPPLAA